MSNFIEICFGIEGCTNPRIEWLSRQGVQIACDNDNCIRLAPDPYADGEQCIEGWIHCDECDKGNSKPIYFKKCFCKVNSDCPEDCEICKKYGESGVCEGQLTTQQQKEGRLCNGDCPPDKPYFNTETETCAECREGSTDPTNPCLVCVQGEWTLKCDNCEKATGDCKECITNTDCSKYTDGRNCCDGEGKCNCCPGFTYDYGQKKCIPIGPCGPDKECGDCQECVEVVAPDGTITYNCEPIKCPPGTKCIKGKQCIPWDCESVTCDNGGDCGPNCGCVTIDGVKQCVPCEILECLGLCKEALGCRCNEETDKCEPLPACSDPNCDGSNPCADPNCTCYKQKCVNCGNFPCTGAEGGCASYQNCQCTEDAAGCEGGKTCKDKITLKKKEECGNVNGCALEAELTVENVCGCDPIEFKIRNLVTNSNSPNILSLELTMFKNSVPYNTFKSSDFFADDELVTGTISTLITYQVQDDYGKWVPSTQVTNIPIRSIDADNNIPVINIAQNLILKTIGGKPTRAFIKVIAQNIQVPTNDCTDYKSKDLGFYVLDFSLSSTQINTLLADYSTYNSTIFNDTTNSRKPLFIWYKSTTGNYDRTPYVNNGVYGNSGYFRKKYVSKTGLTYKDTIDKPIDGLVNNYQYMVKSNCSCNPNSSGLTTGGLYFCCPTDFVVDFDNCNRKVKINSFTTCSINSDLSRLETSTLKFPKESQSNFVVTMFTEGRKTITTKLKYTSVNTLEAFEQESLVDPIVSVRISQTFEGGLLDGEQCFKDYQGDVVQFPNLLFKPDCEFSPTKVKISIPQTTGADLRITDISYSSGDLGLYVVTNEQSGVFVTEIPKLIGGKSVFPLKATVYFCAGNCGGTPSQQETCIKIYDVLSCEVTVDLEERGKKVSNKECSVVGTGVNLAGIASFFDSSLPINYKLTGGDLANPILITDTNPEVLFNNLGAGTYTLVATQGTLEATDTIVINNAAEPIVYFSPASICQGEFTSLIIEALPGTGFSVITPNGGLINVVIDQSGTSTINNLSLGGDYTVTLSNDPSNTYCFPYSEQLTLSTTGQNLTPVIEYQPGSYCEGAVIPFRIVDGGINATYIISANGTGTLSSTQVQANQYEYNATFTPNGSGMFLSIVGIVGDCNTYTPATLSVFFPIAPSIVSHTAICAPDNTHTVETTVTNATSVMIGTFAATNISGDLWRRTGINSGTTVINIQASNTNGCEVNELISLQNCLCPQGNLIITSNGNLCGPGNAAFAYDIIQNQDPDATWSYHWETLNFGNWVQTGITTVFNPMSTPTLNWGLAANQSITVRLVLINNTNNCTYTSNQLTVSASTSLPTPIVSMSPPSANVGTTVTFSTSGGYANYQWSVNGTNVGTNSSSYSFTPSVSGLVTVAVTVTNNTGCTAASVPTNFTIGSNCPSLAPLTYLTSGPCSDIQISITNTIGVSIAYVATGVGSLGTPINQSGTVPMSNIILIDASILDPSEQVTTLNFAFTYTQAGNPECTVNETVTCNYTRCSIATFDIVSASYAPSTCASDLWRFGAEFNFRIPCGLVAGPRSFTVVMSFDGNIIHNQTSSLNIPSVGCFNTGVGIYEVPIDLTVYGGQTGVLDVEVFDGPTNLSPSLGVIVLDAALTLPASC